MQKDLNSDIFPLHYKGPYPTTRGIRVEIAAIILIWLMGIMSQMKVWNIIKKRRQEKAKEQRDKDEERNMADENHGRRVEEGIKRERGSWEAAHGSSGRGKIVHLDSGIGTDEPSTRKGSMSVTGMSETRGLDSEGLELQEMEDPGKYLKEGGRVTVHVAQDDEIPQFQSPTGRRSIGSARETILEPFFHESLTQASRPMGSEAPPRNLSAKGSSKSIGPGLTLKPKITRLPFKVPSPDPQSDDDSSSVAASAASALDPAQSSKRTSGSPITRKLSKRSLRRYVAGSTSEEALMIPYPEDDQASSVAATIDGVSDQANSEDERTKGRSQSPSHDPEKDASMEEPMQGMNQGVDNAASGRSTNHSLAGESQVVGAPSPVGTFALRPEITVLPSSERSRASSIDGLQKTTKQPHNESISKCEASPEDFERRPERASLSGNLPEGASKVVTAYRTNEWAKHLDAADIPDFDELKLNEVRATNSALHNERPVPIDKGALQQTPLDAEPAPMLTLKTHKLGERPASYFKSKDPFKRHSDVHQSRSHMHQLTREKAMERSPSQTSLANSMSRSPSQASLDSNSARKEHYPPMLSRVRSSQSFTSLHRGLRSSSSPLISTPLSAPLAQSPIEEGVEACFPARFTPSTAHLMSQRDSMLRNRPSSTSLLRTTWSNSALDQHPALRSPEDEDDNISLSQRKSLLQKNQQVVPQPRRSSSGPMATPTYTPARDSLTPQPANQEPTLTPRDSTISAWRASLQPSTTAHYRDQEIEHRRSAMLAEKRRESTSRQEQRVGKEVNQNVLDRGMRRSNMLDAHAGMMRKMQAEANKSLH